MTLKEKTFRLVTEDRTRDPWIHKRLSRMNTAGLVRVARKMVSKDKG